MIKPDYKGGSLVNLMSSIMKSFNQDSMYNQAHILKASELNKSKKVILIILDGLGYEHFMKIGKKTFLKNYLRGKILTVFPSTTATVTTTFNTGVAGQQHAITAWNMFLKEIGTDTSFLPFVTRAGKMSLKKSGINVYDILDYPLLMDKIRNFYDVVPRKIVGSNYHNDGKSLHAFNTLNGMFFQLRKIARRKKSSFTYAYWDKLDGLEHRHGYKSKIVLEHFLEFDKKIEKFVKSIQGTDTTIILTADHGQMIESKKKIVDISKHPKLIEMLTTAMTGEKRFTYCYVKPSKAKDFEKYVKKNFRHCLKIFKSEEIIKKGYFGLGKPHNKLIDRIGDYVLIMNDGWIMNYPFPSPKKNKIGHHGGMSKEEMLVPLFVIKS